MEDLITYAHVLFQQSGTNSPPLPPAPLHESAAHVAYGSTHTKLTSMPPPATIPSSSMPPPPVPTSPRKHQKTPSTSGTPRSSFDVQRPNIQEMAPPFPPRPPPQDFTPQLPPRPTNSIHPSLRAGPHAGSPARQIPSVRAGQFFDDQVRVTPQSSLSPTYEGSINTSTSSLPAPLSPPPEKAPSLVSVNTSATAATGNSPPSAGSPTHPPSRDPSMRSVSNQSQPSPVDAPDPFSAGTSNPPDVFSPPQQPALQPTQQPAHPPPVRQGSNESGIELSSTAAAAAFASASPSPPSSSSGHSSPSKRSGHGKKPSASE